MKKVVKILLVFSFLTALSFAASFINMDWAGSDFPYKGGLFLHDGDYVEFDCDSSHSKFYYWTLKSGDCPLEVMERKQDGTWKSIKILKLAPTSSLSSPNFNNFSGWKVFDLSGVSGCLGKKIGLHLRENRTVDGKYYGDKDLIIVLTEGTNVIRWKGVDSYEYCDLDARARKDDKWREYANALADKRISTIEKIFKTFSDISYINEYNEAYKAGLGSILNGISSSYFPPDHLALADDCFKNIAVEYISFYAQYRMKITRSINYVVFGALADVYSGVFDGLQYVVWMQNILNKAIPQSVLSVQEAYNRTVQFKSFVSSIRTASSSKLDSLKQYILNEKQARISNNKEALRNALNSQINLLHFEASDTNPIFTSDQDISKGVDLSLWHIYAKACSIAKSRENNSNYSVAERQAYTVLRILTEKLMASILNLWFETLWVKNAEETSYLLRL